MRSRQPHLARLKGRDARCGRCGKRHPRHHRVSRISHSDYYCCFNRTLPTDSAGEAKVPLPTIAEAIRATLTYPGVITTDDCSWLRVLQHWPEPLTSITDAGIVAVALENKYSVATFDQKLIRRMKALGVESYF